MAIRQLHWEQSLGQPVRIYRNLQNGTMSLQLRVDGRWKVMGHVRNAVLKDVTFHLSESGRQRVIKEQQKNVHAWGEGVLVGESSPDLKATVDLAYNPYRDRTFVQRQTLDPISQCAYLVVIENRVFVSDDALTQSPCSQQAQATATTRTATRISKRQIKLPGLAYLPERIAA